MKEILKQYAAYNSWANQIVADVLLQVPGELLKQNVVSSFTSITATLYHLWYAESVWWQRVKLAENVQPPPESADPQVLLDGWLKQSTLWQEWVYKSTDAALNHEFVYRNTKKEQFKQPVYQVLLHLFNHQSYHRGQIITLLRQLGVQKIPSTDFIEYSRRRK